MFIVLKNGSFVKAWCCWFLEDSLSGYIGYRTSRDCFLDHGGFGLRGRVSSTVVPNSLHSSSLHTSRHLRAQEEGISCWWLLRLRIQGGGSIHGHLHGSTAFGLPNSRPSLSPPLLRNTRRVLA